MDTERYYRSLLDAVKEAGRDPRLAYLVRSRLRRALVAFERGRRGTDEAAPLAGAPTEIREVVSDLRLQVAVLCQPSEALDAGWRQEWAKVLADVERLEDWFECRGAVA
jgi:hypothetical protein